MPKPPKIHKTSSVYLVITDPWGKPDFSRDEPQDIRTRKERLAAHTIGLWFRCMNPSPEAKMPVNKVYMIATRSEVIVKLEKGCNKYDYLGAHLWGDFLANPTPQDSNLMSVMYEYKYENMGNPEKHNWRHHLPTSEPYPADRPFPLKRLGEYPRPSFTKAMRLPPASIRDFTKPLAPTAERPLTPPPETDVLASAQAHQQQVPPAQSRSPVPPVESDANTSFTPYAPPMQHPSHNPNFQPQENERLVKKDTGEREDWLRKQVKEETKDLKPFLVAKKEEADPSTSSVHPSKMASSSPSIEDRDVKPSSVKPEEYQASAALSSTVNAFLHETLPAVKGEYQPSSEFASSASTFLQETLPTMKSEYRPSNDLSNDVDAFLQSVLPRLNASNEEDSKAGVPSASEASRSPTVLEDSRASTETAFSQVKTEEAKYQPSSAFNNAVQHFMNSTPSEPLEHPLTSSLRHHGTSLVRQ